MENESSTIKQTEHRPVLLHQLCGHCQKLDEIPLWQIAPVRGSSESGYWFAHFPDLRAIWTGATSCHLCSIILAAIKRIEGFKWNERLQELSGLPTSKETIVYTCFFQNPNDWDAEVEFAVRFLDKGKLMHQYWGKLRPGEPEPGPGPKLCMSIQRAQTSPFTGSRDCYDMIREWLSTCDSEHSSCKIEAAQHERPTRLLEIMAGGDTIRVISGELTGSQDYATLSYCWGQATARQEVLRVDNKAEYARGIPLSTLSNVIQDAVTVCRALSIDYLWIDALCIIQGPGGDFGREAMRMQDVYAGSVLTIVAASAHDTTQRFLKQRDPRLWIPCQMSQGYIHAEEYCSPRHNVPGKMVIDTRGWCLQERLLSPRSVFFGDRGIHWECRHGIACEGPPGIDGSHTWIEGGKLKALYHDLTSLQSRSSDAMILGKVWNIWWTILEEYAQTELSHEEDRLIALAGIASVFKSRFKLKATYGLWEHFLIHDLLWYVSPYQGRVETSGRAPSWSWASSRRGTFHRSEVMRLGEIKEDVILIESSTATLVGELPSLEFDSLGNNPAPCIPLRIRGYALPCKASHDRGSMLHYESGHSDLYRKDTTEPDGDELLALLLRTEHRKETHNYDHWQKDEGIHRSGLVLAPVRHAEGYYWRIGVFVSHQVPELSPALSSRLPSPKYSSSAWENVTEEQAVLIV